jgi:hypothetical protein
VESQISVPMREPFQFAIVPTCGDTRPTPRAVSLPARLSQCDRTRETIWLGNDRVACPGRDGTIWPESDRVIWPGNAGTTCPGRAETICPGSG